MLYDRPLIEARLIKRYKRFLADVRLDSGEVVTAHCPNPGSMKTCAEPGWEVWISPSTNPKRKLKYTWEIVEVDGVMIGTHPARANGLAEEAVLAGRIGRSRQEPRPTIGSA